MAKYMLKDGDIICFNDGCIFSIEDSMFKDFPLKRENGKLTKKAQRLVANNIRCPYCGESNAGYYNGEEIIGKHISCKSR